MTESPNDPCIATLHESLVSAHRAAAARELGDRTDEASFAALIVALGDRSPLVRAEVERALTRRLEPHASESIRQKVPDPCTADRILASRLDPVADRETVAVLAGPLHRAGAAIEGLSSRADARGIALLGEVWEQRPVLRRQAEWALAGKDIAALAPLFLRGLEPGFDEANPERGPGAVPMRALAMQPDFVARAMRLLSADASWTGFERRRAEKVIEALESHLGASSEEARGWSADPRWLELAQALARSDDAALSCRASHLTDALLWSQGREPFVRIRSACLPEDDVPLGPIYPLVVLGWPVPPQPVPPQPVPPQPVPEPVPPQPEIEAQAEALASDLPPGPTLSLLFHQYGGVACFAVTVLGLGIDLRPHDHEQLKRLAEAWWGGGPWQPTIPALAPWQAALGPRFPPLVRGDEAFLETEPVPSLEAFLGAEVLEVRHRSFPWRASVPPDTDGAIVHRVGPLGRAHLALLSALTVRFGRPPSLFWFASNSD